MTTPVHPPAPPPRTAGLATLSRAVSDAQTLDALVDGLLTRLSGDLGDTGARLDLSTLVQLTGNREKGLEMQAQALAQSRVYQRTYGRGILRVLAFLVAGDLMANTPIDFLLEESDAELTTVYVDKDLPSFGDVPRHDVAFLAISESEDNDALLQRLSSAIARWPRPVVNGRPNRIAALTRDGVAAAFADHPHVLAPVTQRLSREQLLAAVHPQVAGAWDGPAFPIIVRPVGSHAGKGLEKVDDLPALAAYLSDLADDELYVAAFHDYSGPDGLFRKLRIVFIDGRPFLSHMAVSPRWMVHYLNADMAENSSHRAEEAELMARFDETFAVRHRDAFEALAEAFQLDYFGIDCAESADGRLLLFEADVAMIVHAMDPADLYPYKKPAMAKLFAAFVASLAAKASAAGSRLKKSPGRAGA
jgi:hypothetical protein